MPSTHSIHTEVNDTQEAILNLDSITYSKGSAVIKQLVFYIGQEAFRTGMHKYFQKFAWKNVLTNDFVESLQDETQLDIRTWAEEWIKEKGMNSVKIVSVT